MSSDQHDQDDWCTDAASLFRDAQRAHDPTPLERASIDAVLARIQAGRVPPSEAARVSSNAMRGPTPLWLGQIAKWSLAVVLLAAAAFAVIPSRQQPSAATSSEQPASSAALTAAASPTTLPVPAPGAEPSVSPPIPTPLTRRPNAARVRGPRHRSAANVASQRASAPDSDISAVAPGDGASSVTPPSHDTIQHDSTEAISATSPPAAPRATTQEPQAQATVEPAARKPPPPPSELAFLKQMHAKLRESDYSGVLALCAEHERRWPHGVFELEREGVRTIAACSASSTDAKRLASQFLTAHPHAAVAMRVRSACLSQLAQLPTP